jgi:hypothetical protein
MRITITFFGHSTISTTFLTEMRNAMGIPRGLEAIGKTRFATICICAIALERCFPAIAKLVEQGRIALVSMITKCSIMILSDKNPRKKKSIIYL